MLVLGLQGSPRLEGNTARLLSAFMDEAKRLGGEIETLNVAEMDIHPCRECNACRKDGRCVIDDDMQAVYPLLRRADLVAAASPMFFYGVTASLKALIDRSQAMWNSRYVRGLSDPGRGIRRGVFLSVGATKGDRLFEGAGLVFKYFFDAVGARHFGSLGFRGIEHIGDIDGHPTALKDAADLARGATADLLGRRRVLFLCRENACRSQMAWAFARKDAGSIIEPISAGDTPAAAVNPMMIEVMGEVGIDMSYLEPRSIEVALAAGDPELIVSMGCMDACPVVPGVEVIDWEIDDPAGKTLPFMKRTRDDIRRKVAELVTSIGGE
ncbi:MAG: NAD(P)H-dependent oxidoreductase [Deltaproteobacteria bacterium]|nr:NAD(P)H-dependent oxidoreductase [Candidatus Zymogenaceae bacterium]